jgi:hypothetical protein
MLEARWVMVVNGDFVSCFMFNTLGQANPKDVYCGKGPHTWFKLRVGASGVFDYVLDCLHGVYASNRTVGQVQVFGSLVCCSRKGKENRKRVQLDRHFCVRGNASDVIFRGEIIRYTYPMCVKQLIYHVLQVHAAVAIIVECELGGGWPIPGSMPVVCCLWRTIAW